MATTEPLPEGMIRKGGRNTAQQFTERPPPPGPMRKQQDVIMPRVLTEEMRHAAECDRRRHVPRPPEENWIDSHWITAVLILGTFALLYWGLR